MKDNISNSSQPYTLSEAKTDTAVITFGRMNPPTTGHLALVNKMLAVSRQKNGTPLIFLSHSYDAKKNPLSYPEKLKLVNQAFGNIAVKSQSKNIIQVLKELTGKFKNVTIVVGQDRIADMERITKNYNGKDFKFDKAEVVSAGMRDPDADGIQGASASKLRDAVTKGDFNSFKAGLPSKLNNNAKKIYQLVRQGMKLKEDLDTIFEEHLDEAGVLTIAGRRKKAIAARKYKARLKVARKRVARRLAQTGRIKKRTGRAAIRLMRSRLAGQRGKKYSSLSAAEKSSIDRRVRQRGAIIKKLATRIMPQVRKKEFKRFQSFKTSSESINNNFETLIQENLTQKFKDKVEKIKASIDRFRNSDVAAQIRDKKSLMGVNIDSKKKSKIGEALVKKSENSGVSLAQLEQLYVENYQQGDNVAFDRINEYISKHKLEIKENIDNLFEVKFPKDYNPPKEWNKPPSDKEINDMAKHYEKEANKKKQQQVKERKLTPGELEDRESLVTKLKKAKTKFQKRYGRDHENVMYAIATKQAKKKLSSKKGHKAKLSEVSTDTLVNYAQAAKLSLKKDSSKENVKKRTKGLANVGKKLSDRLFNEAVYDADNPKKGIQRTRHNLSFSKKKRDNPPIYRQRQKQDAYKKDDPIEKKIEVSAKLRRTPSDYNRDIGNRKNKEFIRGGKHVKDYGGASHSVTRYEAAVSLANYITGNIPKPTERLKAGIKVNRKKFSSIKNYKPEFNKKVDYDALRVQREQEEIIHEISTDTKKSYVQKAELASAIMKANARTYDKMSKGAAKSKEDHGKIQGYLAKAKKLRTIAGKRDAGVEKAKASMEEENGAGFMGTPQLTAKYIKDTPGQSAGFDLAIDGVPGAGGVIPKQQPLKGLGQSGKFHLMNFKDFKNDK